MMSDKNLSNYRYYRAIDQKCKGSGHNWKKAHLTNHDQKEVCCNCGKVIIWDMLPEDKVRQWLVLKGT